MILLLEDDPKYQKAKDFVRTNFQTAIDKTLGKIEEAEAVKDPLEKTHQLFKLNQDLYLLIKHAKQIVPLQGPKKDPWVWDPDLSKDYIAEFEGARKTAVETYLAKAEELFQANNAPEARGVIEDMMRIYLYEDKWDTEEEKALRTETAGKITELAKDSALQVAESTDTELLEDGIKTLDMALKYSPDDGEIASLRQKIEDRMIDAIIAEGKESEKGGDLNSFIDARKKYRNALRTYENNKKLTEAHAAVEQRIADEYYSQGYAFEKKGDEASIKKALDLYEKGLEYVEGYKKLEDAQSRARRTVAEQYYRKALSLEKGVGRDAKKGQEVIALYKTAQEWVKNYKDTEERIKAVNEAISVRIYVAGQSGDAYRTMEKALSYSMKSKMGSNFIVRTSGASKGGVTPAHVDRNDYLAAAKQADAGYIVVLTGTLGPVQEDVDENRNTKKIDYQITKDGTIEELPKGGLQTLRFGEGAYDTKKKYLDSIDLREYGTANITSIERTRTIYRVFTVDFKVINIDTGSTIYTASHDQRFNASKETILYSAIADTPELRDWYKDNAGMSRKYTKDAPSESEWQKWIADKSDFVTAQTSRIVNAIKNDWN
jgi:hypothetical protein